MRDAAERGNNSANQESWSTNAKLRQVADLAAKLLAAQELDEIHEAQMLLRNWLDKVRLDKEDKQLAETALTLIIKGLLSMMLQCYDHEEIEKINVFICGLLNIIAPESIRILYIKSLLSTICKEFKVVMPFENEKILKLLTQIIGAVFKLVSDKNTDRKAARILISPIQELFINPNIDARVPNKLIYHVADIYIVEMSKNQTRNLDSGKIIICLQPYIQYISQCENMFSLNLIKKSVFIELCEQADRGTEEFHKFLDVDFLKLVKILDSIGKSEVCNQMNREVLYDLNERFEIANQMQMQQIKKFSEKKNEDQAALDSDFAQQLDEKFKTQTAGANIENPEDELIENVVKSALATAPRVNSRPGGQIKNANNKNTTSAKLKRKRGIRFNEEANVVYKDRLKQ